MKGLFGRWVVSALALYLTYLLAQKLGIGIELNGIWTPLLVVAALAIINALIRPLVVVLTLPLNCLTLGLLTFLINALMFWLVGSAWRTFEFMEGFKVHNFVAALFGSVVMGIISGLANSFISPRENR